MKVVKVARSVGKGIHPLGKGHTEGITRPSYLSHGAPLFPMWFLRGGKHVNGRVSGAHDRTWALQKGRNGREVVNGGENRKQSVMNRDKGLHRELLQRA